MIDLRVLDLFAPWAQCGNLLEKLTHTQLIREHFDHSRLSSLSHCRLIQEHSVTVVSARLATVH